MIRKNYIASRVTLRLNVIERTSVAPDFPDLPVTEEEVLGFGVGLWERDARSSLLDFSRSSRCLLNLPMPGLYISIAGRSCNQDSFWIFVINKYAYTYCIHIHI